MSVFEGIVSNNLPTPINFTAMTTALAGLEKTGTRSVLL